MRKLIVFALTVLIFISLVFPGKGSEERKEFLLDNEATRIRLSFEHYKMKDGWTPVVLSMGELDCLLSMDADGRVSVLQESNAQFAEPLCVIDKLNHRVQKDGVVLNFDVYEQNSIRTRWRLSPGTTVGTAKKIFSRESGFDKGILSSNHEWKNKLLQGKRQTYVARPAGTVPGAIPAQERAALMALYNSTNGDNWLNKSGWKTPPLAVDGFALPGTENTWYGITCDPGNTAVQMINPQNNHMSGTLPPELGNLANLTSLDLNNNQLSGSLPKELGNLANLQFLFLDSNRFSGSIPPELGNLANLQDLRLQLNQLSGSIPPELGNLANLLYLSLDSNQLNGTIPTQLGNLANLLFFRLMDNQFSGSIPPQLGNLANLHYISLKSNQLSGSIPPELGNLANLQWLDLNWNQLSGSIPPELGNLANLHELSLYGNQLSGSIPPELGNLVNLPYISLGLNQLSGSIPPELGNLANLTSLYLQSNQLSGSIPPELGNLANMQSLYLYGNQLSGAIPPELGNLANLQMLYLSYNQLSGSIPPELGNLANMEHFLLNSNRLSGSIPPELGNLAKVRLFNLSWNQLNGSIPSELGNLANLENLILNSNQLSGSIPSSLTNLSHLFADTSDLRWNALYTNNDTLRNFLDSKQEGGDWESTQTIAPANVSANAVSTTSIAVNWTPIAYTSDTGGYRVFYSTVHGEPYTFFGMTADKTASSLTVTGLNPGVTYYFTVKTRTNPHTNNLNKVLSRYSAEASTLLSQLVLTAPNGGESWALGTVHHITWSSSGLSGNLRIELWKANKRFCVIASNIPLASGTYSWKIGDTTVVPIPAGTDYRVKIITADGLYNDVGNGNFSIVKY